ncbi:hypothetical protein [Halobacterium salinarum]|nr:hypothetical protein [Halobacterium salinarum]MDL0128439.1 hypothetical protein [Halobacterium salinarum]
MSLTESSEVVSDDMGDEVAIDRGDTSINVPPVKVNAQCQSMSE